MKDDYSYWSENLHSAYLFYTLEVDKLNKENKRLREALEKILIIDSENNCNNTAWHCCGECKVKGDCIYDIAKQALG